MPLPALLMGGAIGAMGTYGYKNIKNKLRAGELRNRASEQKLQSNEMRLNQQRSQNDMRDIADFTDYLEDGNDAMAHDTLSRSSLGKEKGAVTYTQIPEEMYGEPGLMFIDKNGKMVSKPHPSRPEGMPFIMTRSQLTGIRDKYRAGQAGPEEFGANAAGTYSKRTGQIAERFTTGPSKVWVNPKTQEFSIKPIDGGVEVTGAQLLTFMKGKEGKIKDNYLELKDGALIDLTALEESGGDLAVATIREGGGGGGLPGGELPERKFLNSIKRDMNARLVGIYHGLMDSRTQRISGMSGKDIRKYKAASVIAEKLAMDQFKKARNVDIASVVQQAADIVERITSMPGGDKVDILAEWQGGGSGQPADGGGLPPQSGGGAQRLAEMMGR